MVKETRYYDVFEVHPNASLLEIKQSYARLARQYHPDRNCFGTERMQEINMIYNILRDVDQRRLYDLYGDAREANCYHEDEPYVYNYQQEDTDGFDMWVFISTFFLVFLDEEEAVGQSTLIYYSTFIGVRLLSKI